MISEVLSRQPNLAIESHPEPRELDHMFADPHFRGFYNGVKSALVNDISDVVIVGPEFCGKSIVLTKLRVDLQADPINYIVYVNASAGCTFAFLARELLFSLRRSELHLTEIEKLELDRLTLPDQRDFTPGEFVQLLSRTIDNVLLNHGYKRIVIIIDELDDLFTKDASAVTKLFLDLGHIFAEPRYQVICDCLPKMRDALRKADISPDVRFIEMPKFEEQTLCEIVLNRVQDVIDQGQLAALWRSYPFSYSAMCCLADRSKGNLGIALAIAEQALRDNSQKNVIGARDVRKAARRPDIARVVSIVRSGIHYSLAERLKPHLFAIALGLLICPTVALFVLIVWKRHVLAADKAWTILAATFAALISGIVTLVGSRFPRKDA